VPLLGKGLPLLVVRTSDGGDASAAVTYEKIGAGYGTELELVRLALQRNEVLRMAHELVTGDNPPPPSPLAHDLADDDSMVLAIQAKAAGPPRGLAGHVDKLRTLTMKIATCLARRRSLLGSHAPSFDLGGTPYVFTMLRDVEFLESVERKLDLGFETAKRNPLLLPHAHPGFDDLRGDDYVPSAKKGRGAVVTLPHYYGPKTDAERALLGELRAMPQSRVDKYVADERKSRDDAAAPYVPGSAYDASPERTPNNAVTWADDDRAPRSPGAVGFPEKIEVDGYGDGGPATTGQLAPVCYDSGANYVAVDAPRRHLAFSCY
jgi:hypothetical protein